ncbi:MAG: tRNA (adenosine(37)-N6)-threonylcarbamoyltransferase complex dimerization subunit type 1 TsaB [Chlamydiae bacterium]|nr:tRNA (adenosine(37)-N6)-threonylcarbamoyltransferase complex dimerization subunit type 1 TsaB [Chlamydiota bacterium]MBI3266662.1 tRNA (adenosine(37)-N6)-threonylcarbamoyltransferase complex dimerization subunit type 1 TsaB [Chlamydiota bacterium]
MKVLGIETSTRVGSLALVEGGRVLGEKVISENLRHAGAFEEVLADLFRETGVQKKALDAIAVGLGPGSFTGIRIGLAIGKALGFALQKPLWGVGTLDVLAHQVSSPFLKFSPLILGEAREVYGCLFVKVGNVLKKEVPEFVTPIENLKNHISGDVFYFGPALERDGSFLENIFGAQFVDKKILFPSASRVALLAQDSQWRVEGPSMNPLYLKRPFIKQSTQMIGN